VEKGGKEGGREVEASDSFDEETDVDWDGRSSWQGTI